MRRRVVLITGGTRGIGRACALEFARRGLDTVLTYRDRASQAAEVVALCRQHSARSDAVRYDLRGGDPDRLVRSIEEGFGSLDSVVLNAGVWRGGRIDRLDADMWWDVLETNLRGNYLLARACVPSLKRAHSGSLVFMSSAVALTGFPGDTAYASAKSAMFGFASSLARELARHDVRVNVLAPGFVQTDMTDRIPEQSRDRIADQTLMRRFGAAEEVARAAVFLSEDATFTTGAVLPVDGGWAL